MIYQKYDLKSHGFYWLIVEQDYERDVAFGYANLNDDDMAEWGYISITELLKNGAELDRKWEPRAYKDAVRRISEERSM